MDPNNQAPTPPSTGDPNQPQTQPIGPAPQPVVVTDPQAIQEEARLQIEAEKNNQGLFPGAGTPQSVQPMQQPMQQPSTPQMAPIGGAYAAGGNSKLPMVIIAVIAILVLGGGGFAAYKYMGKSDSNDSKSLIAEDKNVSKEGKVGSTVDLDGFELAISAVDKKEKLGEFTEPKVGHVFVVATVRAENKTDHDVEAAPFDFKFLTADGQKLTGTSVYESSEQLPSAGLAPGGSGQGLVMFEVPVDKVDGGFITYEYSYLPQDYTKSRINYSLKVAL